MTLPRAIILAVIASPLLILARDAYNSRSDPRQLLLALGVLLTILANVAVSISLR
ncbi:MAG TPA: hypothetical protein PLJ35_07220 [Anaerolineae bacterium]|nr:hypothetical protein [Anaerolineae bacterium]HOQ98596.1 hypothetical protein [Anaerolineae bacterium]HPL28788.1 hypothetical protein [Anaerolineae bacterium]